MEQGYFYIIPAILAESGKPAKALLFGLLSSLSRKQGYVFATNTEIAEKLGRNSLDKVSRMIGQLEKEGWIERRYHKNKRKIYIKYSLPSQRVYPKGYGGLPKRVWPLTQKGKDNNSIINEYNKRVIDGLTKNLTKDLNKGKKT